MDKPVNMMPNFAPPPNPEIAQWDKATYKEILVGYHRILASSVNVSKEEENFKNDLVDNKHDAIEEIAETSTSIVSDNVKSPFVCEKDKIEKTSQLKNLVDEFKPQSNCLPNHQNRVVKDVSDKLALCKPRPYICHTNTTNHKISRHNIKSLKYNRSIGKVLPRTFISKNRFSDMSSISELYYCKKCIANKISCSKVVNGLNCVQHFKDASSQTLTNCFDESSDDMKTYEIDFDNTEKLKNDTFVKEMIEFENRCLDSFDAGNICSIVDNQGIDSDTDSELEIYIHPDASKIDERLIFPRLINFTIICIYI